jgi:hypothetical protein
VATGISADEKFGAALLRERNTLQLRWLLDRESKQS